MRLEVDKIEVYEGATRWPDADVDALSIDMSARPIFVEASQALRRKGFSVVRAVLEGSTVTMHVAPIATDGQRL